MRVALMARSLRGEYTGVSRYCMELAAALAPLLPGSLTVLLTRAAHDMRGIEADQLRAPFPTPNEYFRAAWEQAVVPLQLRLVRPDVYHSPNYILPLAVRCPTVVTVHDLAFLDASVHRMRSHLYLTALTELALRKASRIICPSRYTRDQLEARYPHTLGRVRVVGEAVNLRFRPADAEALAALRRWIAVDDPYVLFVGTLEPRKNLPRLIQAFDLAVAETGAPHHLVIAGGSGWRQGPTFRALRDARARERIHLVGYIPDQMLPAAYSGADAFAYPSLSEGFGLPPLEAMACGCPVLTSNTSAIPEVVGDAALMADPTDVSSVARGLSVLMTDASVRKDLSARGRARAAKFSWDEVARQVVDVYREAVA